MFMLSYILNALLLCIITAENQMVESSEMILSALVRAEVKYEQFDSDDIRRVNTVDVAEGLGYCRMVVLNPLSLEGSEYAKFRAGDRLQFVAAVALALSHLNAGDGTVIPELEGLQCGTVFTSEFVDSGFRESQTAKSVLSVLDRRDRMPCAFIGGIQTALTAMSATLTTLRGYPQVSPISSASMLSDPEQFRYLARLMPAEGDYEGPNPLLEYLYTQLDVKHLILAYEDDEPTHELVGSMIRNAEHFFPAMRLKTVAIPSGVDSDHLHICLKRIVNASFRYIYGAFNRLNYERFFEAAIQKGLAGKDSSYTWIWSNQGIEELLKGKEFSESSPVFQALSGSLLYSRIGSAPGVGRYDAFVEEWDRLGESEADLEYLRTKILEQTDPHFRPVLDRNVFDRDSPYFSLTPLYYDATILMGMAACKNNKGTTGSFPTGQEHFASVLNTTFVGASGQVALNHENQARSHDSVMYRIWNLSPRKTINRTVALKQVQIAAYEDGAWDRSDDTPIFFADASTNVPPDLPPVFENRNFIGSHVRKVGYTMTAIVLLLSFAFSKWTLVSRNQRIVRASQPIFLHLICIGTGLMGLSIVILSFDDESIGNMDAVCSSAPVLLSLGWCFAFSAIFSKTLRINMIFHNPRFKRIRVTPGDVMKPMILLLSVNVVLLAAWIVLDPLRWEREAILFDEYGRAIESFGFCTSNHAVLCSTALLLVNIGVLAVTSFQSYVARNIATEFSESEYIAKAVGVVVLVSFMAIPIYRVSHENTKSRFLAMASSIFVISLSLLLLVFVPKMFYRGMGVKYGIRRSIYRPSSDVEDDTKSLDQTRRSLENDEDDSDDSVGVMRVIAHPKLYSQLEEKYRASKQENANLKQIIRQIRQSQPPPESISRKPSEKRRKVSSSLDSTSSTSSPEAAHARKPIPPAGPLCASNDFPPPPKAYGWDEENSFNHMPEDEAAYHLKKSSEVPIGQTISCQVDMAGCRSGKDSDAIVAPTMVTQSSECKAASEQTMRVNEPVHTVQKIAHDQLELPMDNQVTDPLQPKTREGNDGASSKGPRREIDLRLDASNSSTSKRQISIAEGSTAETDPRTASVKLEPIVTQSVIASNNHQVEKENVEPFDQMLDEPVTQDLELADDIEELTDLPRLHELIADPDKENSSTGASLQQSSAGTTEKQDSVCVPCQIFLEKVPENANRP